MFYNCIYGIMIGLWPYSLWATYSLVLRTETLM